MKVIYIVPGSGNRFYCQNCLRDEMLVREMRTNGLDVVVIPLYLPMADGPLSPHGETPVFYGAVNVYLSQVIPGFSRLPRGVKKAFDAKGILRWAARRAESTRASGLEKMTISMLRGEEGRQAAELDALVRWLCHEGRPDIVHISNALLIGMAQRLRTELGAKIVCSLQDESDWVDGMRPEYQSNVWTLMGEAGKSVDAFVSVSGSYAQIMARKMDIPDSKMHVIYPGVQIPDAVTQRQLDRPVLGFLSRLSNSLGLGIVTDAFLRLKRDPEFSRLELHVAGGMTQDDEVDIAAMLAAAAAAGVADSLRVIRNFDPETRGDFLSGLTVLSVPVPGGEAFGMYIPEAWSYGVPVVQPNVGAFAELLGAFGGGVLYEPDASSSLADALSGLLRDHARLSQLSAEGRQAVEQHLSVQISARKTAELYATLVS